MSRPVHSSQVELYKRASATPLQLLKLTTYSDLEARTVQSTFYLSSRPCRYDYGNTGTQVPFWPLLREVGQLSMGIPHLPDPSSLPRRELELVVSNEDWRLAPAISALRASNLFAAKVELAELLLSSEPSAAALLDLSALAGDEHTVWFRGEVQRVGPIDDEGIVLRCRSVSPQISWGRSTEDLSAPGDFGVRAPIVYGQAKKVRGVVVARPGLSTLAFQVEPSTTTFELTDGSVFDTVGSGVVGAESFSWTGKSGNSLTGITRAQFGTKAAVHKAGEVVAEAPTATRPFWIAFAQHRISALQQLYARNPATGELTKIQPSLYNLSGPEGNYGYAIHGFPCTFVSITASGLRAIAAEFFVSAVVKQQASTGSVTPTTITQHPTSVSGLLSPNNPANVNDNNTATTVALSKSPNHFVNAGFDVPPGPITSQTIRVFVTSITISGGFPRVLVGNKNVALSSSTGWQTFTFTDIPNSHGVSVNSGSSPPGAAIVIGEIERSVTYNAPPAPPAILAEIEAASVGYGLELWADVDGVMTPSVWQEAYDCDDASGWNADGCTFVSDSVVKREGLASLKVEKKEANTTLLNAADATAGWTGANCTPTVDTSYGPTQGTGSIKGVAASAAVTSLTVSFSALNVSSPKRYIAFDLNSGYTTMNGVVQVLLKSGAGDFIWFDFDALQNFAPGTWYTVLIHPDSTPAGSSGSFNPAAVTDVQIQWNNGSTKESGATFVIDNVRYFADSWNIQKNDLPNLDFTAATAGEYRLLCRASQIDTVPRDVVVYFADAAGSGTTIPANRWDLEFFNLDQFMREQEWFRIEFPSVLLEVNGSPGTISAVSTFGVFVALGSLAHGVHRVLAIDFSVWIDLVERRASDAGSEYEVAPGALIEHPVDVLRHLVEEIGGETLDDTTAAEAVTNLGASAKLAFDLRALTAGSWAEAAGRIAFESRANLVPEERATGTVWRILTAKADFSFPVPTKTLARWAGRSELDRDLEQLFTRFTFLYAPDPSLGDGRGGEESFRKAILIGPGTLLTAPSASEVQAAERLYGARQADPIFLLCHQDDAFAQQVAAYIAHELLRAPTARTFGLDSVPWYDGDAYELEVGDLRLVSSRWDGTPPKARVIEIVRGFSAEMLQFGIRAVEVETS